MGLLDLIDEESRFPQATDQSLAEKLHDNINSPHYNPPKDRGPRFTIIHYAGAVTYETTSFLEKNRDNLHPDVMHLLKDSGNALVRQFFYASVSRTGGIAGPVEPQPSATPLFRRRAPGVGWLVKVGAVGAIANYSIVLHSCTHIRCYDQWSTLFGNLCTKHVPLWMYVHNFMPTCQGPFDS